MQKTLTLLPFLILVGCSSPGIVVHKGKDGTITAVATSPSIGEDSLSDEFLATANIPGLGEFSVHSRKIEKDQTEIANAYFTTEAAKAMITGATAKARSSDSVKKAVSKDSVRKVGINADKAVKLKALEHVVEPQ